MNTLRNNRNQFLPFGFDAVMRPKFEAHVNSQMRRGCVARARAGRDRARQG